MLSPSPTCLVHSRDPALAQRIKGLLHGRAEVSTSGETDEFFANVERSEPAVVFLDALNRDLFPVVEELQRAHPENPVIILGEDVSEQILTLDQRFAFAVASPAGDNRTLLRAFSVAQNQLELIEVYRTRIAEAEQTAQWNSTFTPRPGQVIRGMLCAFAGFRTPSDLLERSMDWIQETYDVSDAGIYLRQPADGRFELSVSLKESSMQAARSFAADHGFVSHLQRIHKIVHRSTLEQLNPSARSTCEHVIGDIKAEAIFPMGGVSGLMGWLFVGHGSLKELSQDDLKELNMIASCLAAFLERNEEQAAKLRDAETSHALLDHLDASTLILDDAMTVTWMNHRAGEIFGDRYPETDRLEELDAGFAEVLQCAIANGGQNTHRWSPSNDSVDYAVTVIPMQAPSGYFVLLQGLHSGQGMETEAHTLPGEHRHSNLCTKIRDPLVAIRTFIELLPERRLEAEFCEKFMPIVSGSVDRLENLTATLERHVNDRAETTEDSEYALRHLLEDVFSEIGESLQSYQIKNTRDVFLKWPHKSRRVLTEHLAHLASVEGWGENTIDQPLTVEWIDLAESEEIRLVVSKQNPSSMKQLPVACSARDGLGRFLDRHRGSLGFEQHNNIYSLNLTVPKSCP